MRKTARTDWAKFAAYSDLGLRFAAAAAVGGYLGYLLDQKFHLYPFGLIVGIMLGGTAGFISLYRTVVRLTDSESARKRRDTDHGPEELKNKT